MASSTRLASRGAAAPPHLQRRVGSDEVRSLIAGPGTGKGRWGGSKEEHHTLIKVTCDIHTTFNQYTTPEPATIALIVS